MGNYVSSVQDTIYWFLYIVVVSIIYWRSFATSLSLLLPSYSIISKLSSRARSYRIDFFHCEMRIVLSRKRQLIDINLVGLTFIGVVRQNAVIYDQEFL